MNIKKFKDPILSQKCKPVGEISSSVLDLCDDLKETLDREKGLGLAAPQLGYLLQVLVIDQHLLGFPNRERFLTLINPELVKAEGAVTTTEGCLSFPGVPVKVQRRAKIWIKAKNERGEPIELEGEGIWAICVQHEMDHLQGITILDKLPRNVRQRLLA